jgi:hypothetical protein
MTVFSLDRIQRGLASPNLFLREANRIYYRRLYSQPYNTSGIDLFNSDWDNLLILDAGRYDMFAEQSSLPGRLESRQSRGSSTWEFLKANFAEKELHDTVYVTANPQFYRHKDWLETSFHAVDHVWKTDGWDEDHRTVLPETTTKHARSAAEQYPNKRLLVHYIQPHYPFITEDNQPFDDNQAFLKPDTPGSWAQLMTGDLDAAPDKIWRAYRANLDRTLPHVEQLLNEIDGKSVVTADHGNMIGERASPIPIREWGHPHGIYTNELVKVPWLVVDGERRHIDTAPPVKTDTEPSDDVVARRLEDLGYQ